MSDKRGEKKNQRLFFALVLLLAVILALAISIILVNVYNGNFENKRVKLEDVLEEYEEGYLFDPTIAKVFSEKIMDKLDSDTSYSYEDAVFDYERAYDKAGNGLKIYITMMYADFVYNRSGDADRAVEILGQVEDLITDDITRNIYYNALVKYYKILGENEKVKYYEQLLSEEAPSKEIPLDIVYEMMGGFE